MRRANATALGIDAGRTLLFDREGFVRAADEAGIAIQAFAPDTSATKKIVMSENPIRVAVVGAGEFGRNHVRVWREMEGVELAGVVDTNAERAAKIAAEFGTKRDSRSSTRWRRNA